MVYFGYANEQFVATTTSEEEVQTALREEMAPCLSKRSFYLAGAEKFRYDSKTDEFRRI